MRRDRIAAETCYDFCAVPPTDCYIQRYGRIPASRLHGEGCYGPHICSKAALMLMLTAELIHALPPSARRGMSREEAASYIGVSVGSFDKLVRSGDMPSPIKLVRRKIWDKRALDRWLDQKSDIEHGSTAESTTPASSLDAWRRARGKH